MNHSKANEASRDSDYEAAVIQLRQGRVSNTLKFGAFLLLISMVVGFVVGLSFSIATITKSAIGV